MASISSSTDRKDLVNRVMDIKSEPRHDLPSIKGFENEPLVTLEEAVKPLVNLVQDVESMVQTVKKKCLTRPPTQLTLDQHGSIMLYTSEWSIREQSLYFILNQTLRSPNRNQLKPWFLFLKLFLVALLRLPTTSCHLYRGVKGNLAKEYPIGSTMTWWGFSSCTKNVQVLGTDSFLGQDGERTLFTINNASGTDIREYSYYPSEDEILLLAARQFHVDSCVQLGHGLQMIQLTEVPRTPPLLADVSQSIEIGNLLFSFSCD